MYVISKTMPDRSRPSDNLYINLNPDKPLHPSKFIAPITWTGFVGGKQVKFIQKVTDPFSLDDFEFIEFPEKYNYTKGDIFEWIDEACRIMD